VCAIFGIDRPSVVPASYLLRDRLKLTGRTLQLLPLHLRRDIQGQRVEPDETRRVVLVVVSAGVELMLGAVKRE